LGPEGLARTRELRTKWRANAKFSSRAPLKTTTALLYSMQNAVDTKTTPQHTVARVDYRSIHGMYL